MPVINVGTYSVHGTLPGGEVWACTVYAALGAAIDTPAAAQTNVDAVKASAGFTAFVTALKPILHSSAAITGLTGRFYPSLPGPSQFTAESAVAGAVGTSTVAHPNQTAVVASLLTLSGGRSGRGRLYLPGTGANLDGTAQMSQALCDSLAGGVKGLLDGIDSASTGATSSVYSAKLARTAKITGVRVDSRADTMRRRANKQLAVRSGSVSR